MGLLDRLKRNTVMTESPIEEKALIDDITEDDEIVEILYNKREITREVAEKIAALNQGISIISETIASLPCYLYKRDENNDREKVSDYRNSLLNIENAEYETSFNMKKDLVRDYILYGNGYLDINKDVQGNIKSLMHIPYKEVTLNYRDEINKRNEVYSYDYWGMSKQPAYQVLNLVRNSKDIPLKGTGLLKEASNTLGLADSLESYQKTAVDSGFSAKGVVEKDMALTKRARDSLKESIRRFFSGKKNSGKVMILDDGLHFKPIDLSPTDLKLLEQKEFTIRDIARFLKLQPSILGVDTKGMTYSNEKDNQLQFLKNCIHPILVIIENTFNKYLLTEKEKREGYFFEFSTLGLLRTNPKDEIEMYGEAVKSSIMQINEARRKLNWKPIDGMDRLKIELNQGLIQDDGTILCHQSTTKGGDNNGKEN